MIESRDSRPRRRMTAFGAVLGVAGLLALSLATGANAAGEYEPNDTRETAYGPLAGGTPYTGTFETDNDVDWYVFYVKTYSQMDFSATMVKSSCDDYGRISLYDKDGNSIRGFYIGEVNETSHLLLTMDPGRYYFEVDDYYACTGDQYRFQIDPAASITTSRECGEAIVARDAVGPQLADLNTKLTRNAEKLVEKAEAVKNAKGVVSRLKRHRWASRYEKRLARRRLDRAKAARDKVLQARANLLALAGQHQQTLPGAEGQIATYC